LYDVFVKNFTFTISSPDEFLFKWLLLRNCAVDFVEICNVYVGKMMITAAKSKLILIRYAIVIVI